MPQMTHLRLTLIHYGFGNGQPSHSTIPRPIIYSLIPMVPPHPFR